MTASSLLRERTNPALGGVTHARMANAVRLVAVDAVETANAADPGMPMGARLYHDGRLDPIADSPAYAAE
jgi:hypothetical protein